MPDREQVGAESAEAIDHKEWADFLAAWVDYNHGSGTSDQAWDAYQGLGNADTCPTWVPSPAARKAQRNDGGEPRAAGSSDPT